MKAAIALGLLAFVVCVYSQEFNCIPGVPYKEDCNSCACIRGSLHCTYKTCRPPICKPGRTWYSACNRCWCFQLSNGEKKQICENKLCLKPLWFKKHVQ